MSNQPSLLLQLPTANRAILWQIIPMASLWTSFMVDVTVKLFRVCVNFAMSLKLPYSAPLSDMVSSKLFVFVILIFGVLQNK